MDEPITPSTPQGPYGVKRSVGAEERALKNEQARFDAANPQLVALQKEVAALRALIKPYVGGNGIRVDDHLISLEMVGVPGGGAGNGILGLLTEVQVSGNLNGLPATCILYGTAPPTVT